MCGLPAETFPRPPVDFGERVHDFSLADRREVQSFREEIAQEAVGFLVAAALPGRVRVGEIERYTEGRPVPERLACAHLPRSVRDSQPDVDAPACLHRFSVLSLLAEHGRRHVNQPRVDPAIDGREGDSPVEEPQFAFALM